MSVHHHIEIPKSFGALYTNEGAQQRHVPRDFLAIRYELCEDMARMLVDIADHMASGLGIPEQEALARCHFGLRKGRSAVTESESDWIIRRLAELLEWGPLSLPS